MSDQLSQEQNIFINKIFIQPRGYAIPSFIEEWGKNFLKITLLYFDDLKIPEVLDKLKKAEPEELINQYKKSSNPTIEQLISTISSNSDSMLKESFFELIFSINRYEHQSI